MASIKDQIKIIKDVVSSNDKENIIKKIANIHPIILMYYQMMDNTFEYYNDKLPDEYFNFDINDAIKMFIQIGDANFVNYIIKEFNFHKHCFVYKDKREKGTKIIETMIEYYIYTDDINNLNIIHDNINFGGLESFNTTYYIINNSIIYNKPKILELFLMDPNNNNEDNAEPNEFNNIICSHIMYRGDLVDIVNVFHKYSKKYPDFINFDFNIVFNAALVYGREKCMQYVLNNGTINYHYEKEGEGFTTVNEIYPFTDSIMYAIIGKNINCVRTIFDMFMSKINNDNWIEYFKFASVYGTLEIIKYMLTIKPHLVEQIDDFYNNILKFALCEANIDIVKFAIINGANYSKDMHEFVKDYNNGRGPEEAVDEDYIDFYMKKYALSDNFNEKYIECIRLINNF